MTQISFHIDKIQRISQLLRDSSQRIQELQTQPFYSTLDTTVLICTYVLYLDGIFRSDLVVPQSFDN